MDGKDGVVTGEGEAPGVTGQVPTAGIRRLSRQTVFTHDTDIVQ